MIDIQSPHALPVGTFVEGYRIEQVLGIGSFGIVYRATNKYFDAAFAIKEFLPSELACRVVGNRVTPLSQQTEESYTWALDRFIKEAKILWELGRPTPHPSIVRVVGFHEANGTAYMVMDYEDGEPLSSILRDSKTIPQTKLEAILGPLLDGLERIHAASVLHRDIKPANILIRRGGTPVLIDFGAARRTGAAGARSTMVAYTPDYAPPEQMTGAGEQGPWTDIYALGATLYHAVTGKVPTPPLARTHGSAHVGASKAASGHYHSMFLQAIDAAIEPRSSDRPQSIPAFRAMLPPSARREYADRTIIRPNLNGWENEAKPAQEFAFDRAETTSSPTRITKPQENSEQATHSSKAPKIKTSVIFGIGFALVVITVVITRKPEPKITREALLEQIKEITRVVDCSHLVPDLGRDLTLTVSGHVSDRESIRDLTRKLEGIASISNIDTRGIDVYERPFCEVVALLTLNQASNISDADRVHIDFNKIDGVYREGEQLVVHATATHVFDGYLYVDYFDSVGNVVHMLPSPVKPDNRVEAGSRITLGLENPEEHPEERYYTIVAPHGRNLIVAISTTAPLYSGQREETEKTSAYLVDLRLSLEKTKMQAEPIVAFNFIKTSE